MGTLFYGGDRVEIAIDDVLLRHVSAVITAKLRRNEPFLLTWEDADAIGDGSSAVWIHPSCDLHYKYAEKQPTDLDRSLLERMSRASSSAHGLYLDSATLKESPEEQPAA